MLGTVWFLCLSFNSLSTSSTSLWWHLISVPYFIYSLSHSLSLMQTTSMSFTIPMLRASIQQGYILFNEQTHVINFYVFNIYLYVKIVLKGGKFNYQYIGSLVSTIMPNFLAYKLIWVPDCQIHLKPVFCPPKRHRKPGSYLKRPSLWRHSGISLLLTSWAGSLIIISQTHCSPWSVRRHQSNCGRKPREMVKQL